MVDASLSISAARPPPRVVRAAPAAAPFAASLPDPEGAPPPVPAVPSAAGAPGPADSGVASSSAAARAGGAPTFPPAPVRDASAAAPGAAAGAAAPSPAAPSAFHVLLSELNPLQYVPVVGTIYRAVTGDTIPEAARFAGGLVVSGLTGGPIGLAMNVGATLLEHLVGIDPEKIGDRLLAELGIGHAPAAHPAAALASAGPASAGSMSAGAMSAGAMSAGSGAGLSVAGPSGAAVSVAAASGAAPAGSSARAWSPAQLAAYGVTGAADGTLRRGALSGADVLNSLELTRVTAAA